MRKIQTDRNIVMMVLLSILTCGLYGYWFVYTMSSDVNVMCDGDGEKTEGLLMFILLSVVTCGLYAYYWYYKLGNRLQANAPKYGLTFTENGTTVLMWCVLGLLVCGLGQYVGIHILIKNTNAMAVEYNAQNNL